MFSKIVSLIFCACILVSIAVFGQNKKQLNASLLTDKIKIDGVLDESSWSKADSAFGFTQTEPVFGAKVSNQTVVKILFDQQAVYIGALCYDSSPDSILAQLGNRDDVINADLFSVQIDPYNQAFDAYYFQLSASNVQIDWREQDNSYNAVWESKVAILSNAWSLEMKIPYSALRFPATDIQSWGINFFRHLRRYRENSEWSPAPQGSENALIYWGKLDGLKGIEPPIRLHLYPYLSFSAEHYPANIQNQSNWSFSYNGGLDLKYGLNQSFTLDLTLLPDFTQVQSDNKVKNLSAFETTYEEQRSFFTEAVDLFSRNSLFYSRRIGQTPRFFYNVAGLEDSTHSLKENPAQAQLINAFKISGRNANGLALGILNAITNESNAVLQHSDGSTKKVLTEPLTNYNILVADQTFGKGSSAYLMQTSVLRKGEYRDGAAWGGGLNLLDDQSKWGVKSQASYTLRSKEINDFYSLRKKEGYNYSVTAGKFSGKFKTYISYSSISKDFDANDLGLSMQTDQNIAQLFFRYTIFNPFWKILDFNNSLVFSAITNGTNGSNYESNVHYSYNLTTSRHLSLWGNINLAPFDRYDYFEPRMPGYYYIHPGYYYMYQGFSSDYRHPFALDGSVSWAKDFKQTSVLAIWIKPLLRVNDHLYLYYEFNFEKSNNDVGFADYLSDKSVFGRRNVETYEHSFYTQYIFKNNLSLSIVARNYWSGGKYNQYYLLNQKGEIDEIVFTDSKDFIFNTFNIDLNFKWEFSPGSLLSLTWKNYIQRDENLINPYYSRTFGELYDYSQQNILSMKMMYYLDYFTTKSKLKRKS